MNRSSIGNIEHSNYINNKEFPSIFENYYYWLYSSERFLLVKITKVLTEKKEIYYKEQEIVIDNDNDKQIKFFDKLFAEEKKANFKDAHLFKLFSKNQIDINSDNLLDTSDVSYSTLLYNLKLKLLKNNNIIKAGKIFLGINMLSCDKSCYEKFVSKFFNLKFEDSKNLTVIVNGLPNTGKSQMIKHMIRHIINLNFFNNSVSHADNVSMNYYSNNSEVYTNEAVGALDMKISHNEADHKANQKSREKVGLIQNLSKQSSTKLDKHCYKNILFRKIFLFLELMDLFGNTIESETRMNCSRYMRIVKFLYLNNSNQKSNSNSNKHKIWEKTFDQNNLYISNNVNFNYVKKVKIKHFLLEKNRILNKEKDKFYFHIVHVILHGLNEILNSNNKTDKNSFYSKVLLEFPDYIKYLIENYSGYSAYIISKVKDELDTLYQYIPFAKFFSQADPSSGRNWEETDTELCYRSSKAQDEAQGNIRNLSLSLSINLSDSDLTSRLNLADDPDKESPEQEQQSFLKKFFLEKFRLLLKISSEISLHKKILIKIFNIILLILHIKDLSYLIDDEEKVYLNSDDELLIKIFSLMNLETEEEKGFLIKKLTAREIISPSGSLYLIKLSFEEATRLKDNLIKFLYENLFNFLEKLANFLINIEIEQLSKQHSYNLINICNSHNNSNSNNLKPQKDCTNYIQLIECFGFENSSNPLENNLENLFVNYSNDKINNTFLDLLVKSELEIYKKEGLSSNNSTNSNCKNPNTYDNTSNSEDLFDQLSQKIKNLNNPNSSAVAGATATATASLVKRNSVTQKPQFAKSSGLLEQDIQKTLQICEEENKGIFSTINSQSILIKNNKGLITSLINNIKNNWPEIQVTNKSFILNHIGSFVEYGGEDFILRNTETLKEDLKLLFKELFKNLIGLTTKNFSLEKEVMLSYFNKTYNFSSSSEAAEKNKPANLASNKTIQVSNRRNSVIGRASTSAPVRTKFSCENFLIKFRKIIAKISSSDLSIIKLLKSGPEKKIFCENNNHINSNRITNSLNIFNKADANAQIDFSSTDAVEQLNDIYKTKFIYEHDDKILLKQIFSSGILESLLLTKSGYFFRCDFSSLKNKLGAFNLFRIFFNDLESCGAEVNNLASKDDKGSESRDNSNKNKIISFGSNSNKINLQAETCENEHWKPDKNFIELASRILSVKEADLVVGKTCIFLKNQAIIEKHNDHYFKLKDLPSLIIFNLVKIAFRKVKNLNKFFKFFNNLTLNKKAEKFVLLLISIFNNKKILKVFSLLQAISSSYISSVVKIQKFFRCYKEVSDKLRLLQRNIIKLLIKSKIKKRKQAKLNFLQILFKAYEKKLKKNKFFFFSAFSLLANIRKKCAKLILLHYKKYSLRKKTLTFTYIINSILIKLIKKILFKKLKLIKQTVSSVITLQSLTKRFLSIKKLTSFKLIQETRKSKIKNFIENNLTNILKKKLFNKFYKCLQDYQLYKNSKVAQIQMLYRNYIQNKQKERRSQENCKAIVCILAKLFINNFKNKQSFILKKINENIQKNIFVKKAEASSKIINLLRKNFARKKCEQLKKLKIAENERQLKIGITRFITRLNSLAGIMAKKSFLKNFMLFNKNILQLNNNAVKIQSLMRTFSARKKLSDQKRINIFMQKLIAEVYILSIKKNAKFLIDKMRDYHAALIARDKKAILIQAFIRRKISLDEYKLFQAEKNQKQALLNKKLERLACSIQKVENNNFKIAGLLAITKFSELCKVKENNAIRLQSQLRRINAKAKLAKLQKIKAEEKRKILLTNKLMKFTSNIEYTKKLNSMSFFLNAFVKFSEYQKQRQTSAVAIQSLIRRKYAKEKFKQIKNIQEQEKRQILAKKLSMFTRLVDSAIKINSQSKLFSSLKAKHRLEILKEKDRHALLIQCCFKGFLAKQKLNKLKEIKNAALRQILIKNKIEKFLNFIAKAQALSYKASAFTSLTKFHAFQLLTENKAIQLQSFIRKIAAAKKCERLKIIKAEKLRILQHKLNAFTKKIFLFISLLNKNTQKAFLRQLARMALLRNELAIRIQNNFIKYLSKKQLRLIQFVNKANNILKNNNKKVLFKHFIQCFSIITNAIKRHKSAIVIQNFMRKIKANNKLTFLKAAKRNVDISACLLILSNITHSYSLASKVFCQSLKKQFMENLKAKYRLIQAAILIQLRFRYYKTYQRMKLKLNSSLKAFQLLNIILDKNLILKKEFFYKSVSEYYRKIKIKNIFYSNKAKKIQNYYREYKILQQIKQFDHLNRLKRNILTELVIKQESKKTRILTLSKFLLFRKNFKIKKIIENFCHKIYSIHTRNKYLTKIFFKKLKYEYIKNKQSNFLRKLFSQFSNLRTKYLKKELISVLRVSAKYYFNKQKQLPDSRALLTPQENLLSIKEQQEKLEKKNENKISDAKNTKIQETCKGAANSDKVVSSYKINSNKALIANARNSVINPIVKNTRLSAITKNTLDNKLENNDKPINNKNNSNKNSNKSVFNNKKPETPNFEYDWDFGPYKRFRLNKNLFKPYDDMDDEKPNKFNAANTLISKYSRASHKIDINKPKEHLALDLKCSSDNRESNINYNYNNNHKNSNADPFSGNNNKDADEVEHFSIVNELETGIFKEKETLTARDSAGMNKRFNNPDLIFANEKNSSAAYAAKNNPKIKNNCINNNKNINDVILNDLLNSNKLDVPSYKEIYDISNVEFFNLNCGSATGTRKSEFIRPKNILENLKSNDNKKSQNENLNQLNKPAKVKFLEEENENNKFNSMHPRVSVNKPNSNTQNNKYSSTKLLKQVSPIKIDNKTNKQASLINNNADELFAFNVNKNKRVNYINNNNLTNSDKKNRKNSDCSKRSVAERIEQVFKNLDTLKMMSNDLDNNNKNNNI